MKTIQKVHEITKKVDGWLTHNEGEILFNLANNTEDQGLIVEIGSWKGKSTIYIASALQNKKRKYKFYAVDPHIGSEEHQKEGKVIWTFDIFKKNISDANLGKFVVPVLDNSVSFSKEITEPFEMIFIDGAHDYQSVESDFLAWFPHVVNGGVMLFHDTYSGGDSYKVLKKYVYKSRNFDRVRTIDSITYARKLEKNKIHTYILNRLLIFFHETKLFLYRSRFLKSIIFMLFKKK